MAAWVLCPSRHTITGLIGIADPEGRRAHDAYHRFFRAGAWRPELAWKAIATAAVRALYAGAKVLCLDVDDTLWGHRHKVSYAGPRIMGASRPWVRVCAGGVGVVNGGGRHNRT